MAIQVHWPISRRAQWGQGAVELDGKGEERGVEAEVVVELWVVEELPKFQLLHLHRRLLCLQNLPMPIRTSIID